METVYALSVLDGRYENLVHELKEIFSEYGLIKHRVVVEIKWLTYLVNELRLVDIGSAEISKVDTIMASFNPEAAMQVKAIEKTTNHDVKAVEYYIKEKLQQLGLGRVSEWVHFALTSDDVNNSAYALMMKAGRKIIADKTKTLQDQLTQYGAQYRSIPMMSRTHGQPASPTTVGKEMINFAARLQQELTVLNRLEMYAKLNGATGNFNAHAFAYPDIDWITASSDFIVRELELVPAVYTTQINPSNYIAELLHAMIRIAAIVIDLDRDFWGYISLGYFKQKVKEGEVGSSTMPHKVNPIDFENSEGNMGIAIAMMEHLAVKLLNSRFQRDLTDSTVLRNMGALYGYMLIGLKNTLKGLSKIDMDTKKMAEDLAQNVELLAEPIQTIMRIFGEENPYEKLKAMTRGRKITLEMLHEFIEGLEKVPPEIKARMKDLRVDQYTGLAERLVDVFIKSVQSPPTKS